MTPSTKYDCLIVGGGVAGTALLYELARFTDLKRLCLLERYEAVGRVNSHANHNGQTLHCGDLDTGNTPEQARSIRRTAGMLINYATKLPARERDRIVFTMPKMVLGVGHVETAYLRERFEAIKDLYPRMQLLERRAIADLEPNVALVDGAWRPEKIVAIGTPGDYCAVDFAALAESFSHGCVRLNRGTDKQITQLCSTTVGRIRRDGPDYVLETNRGLLQARAVVVCAGGHSLLMAQAMGLGLEYSCLPMAGSFYFSPEALNGKVYRVQNPSRLPFAAVHGDHDIKEPGRTRFGPTTLMLPRLKRRDRTSGIEFLQAGRFDRPVASALWGLAQDPALRNALLRHVLYEIPGLNRKLFINEIKKIVPSLTAADITYADGQGGVRPLFIDRTTGRARLGETKISNGDGIVFNLTSPNGTSCLASGETDMRAIARRLGAQVDEQAFERELLMGYEDSRTCPRDLDSETRELAQAS